jgi:DNA-binding MarR family transcriptional regulator
VLNFISDSIVVMSTPRWLSDSEQRAWRAFLQATQRLSEQLDRELQQQAGMPLAYYQILAMLSEAPARTLRMSELAQRTWSSRSRLSHAVDRLEENGWVERIGCPSDKRGSFAVLTEAGFEVLAAAAPEHVESVRRHLFDKLSAEQVEELANISEQVAGEPDGAVGCDLTGRRQPAASGGEELAEVHPRVEDVLPQVAELADTLGHVQHVELGRVGAVQLLPAEGCGHPGPIHRPG